MWLDFVVHKDLVLHPSKLRITCEQLWSGLTEMWASLWFTSSTQPDPAWTKSITVGMSFDFSSVLITTSCLAYEAAHDDAGRDTLFRMEY